MRQKRQYATQRDGLYSQQTNILHIAGAREQARDTNEILSTMQQAKKELKTTQKRLKVDEIEKMRDELEDLFYEAQEVQTRLSRPYHSGLDIDETDLMEEFGALGDTEDTNYLTDALPKPEAAVDAPEPEVITNTPEPEPVADVHNEPEPVADKPERKSGLKELQDLEALLGLE